MREGPTLRARQLRAHDDAVVGERVVDDEVARAEEGGDRRDVGRVPTDEGETRFLLIVFSERRFERPVHRPFACYEPARRGRDPIPVDGIARRCPHRGMMVKPEVVVRGKVDHATAGDDGKRAGVAFVQQEIGVPKTHSVACGAQQALLGVAGQRVELQPVRHVRAPRRRRLGGIGRRGREAAAFSDQRIEKAPVGIGQSAVILIHSLWPPMIVDDSAAVQAPVRDARSCTAVPFDVIVTPSEHAQAARMMLEESVFQAGNEIFDRGEETRPFRHEMTRLAS